MKLRLLLASIVLSAGWQASAADQLLLTFNIPQRMGIPIGQSTVPDYGDSIDLTSWSLGVNNVDNTPVVLPLNVTKAIDRSSAQLVQSAITSQVFDEVWFTITDPAFGSQYSLRLVLFNARVVSVTTSGIDNQLNGSTEAVSISCESYTLDVRVRDPSGAFTNDPPQISTGVCGG